MYFSAKRAVSNRRVEHFDPAIRPSAPPALHKCAVVVSARPAGVLGLANPGRVRRTRLKAPRLQLPRPLFMIGACRSVSGPAADWRDGALWVSNGDESWCEPGSEPAGWTSGPDRDRTSSRRESSEDIGQGPSAQHRAGEHLYRAASSPSKGCFTFARGGRPLAQARSSGLLT